MTKELTNANLGILNLIITFNSISKYLGFAVTEPDDTSTHRLIREIIFLFFLFFAIVCTAMAELWHIKFVGMGFDVRKVVVFVITQIAILSPFSILLCFRLCDLPVWKIILKIKRLEENLIMCNTYLQIGRVGFVGIFFWFFQFFIIMIATIYLLWSTVNSFIIEGVCIFFFEAWVTVPYLQFISWISFLCYVSRRVRFKIIEINEFEFLTRIDLCRVKYRLNRTVWDQCQFNQVDQIKRIIRIIKQILNIARELSTVYEITVLLYIINYVSKVVLHFYDLLDSDAQKLSVWMGVLNVIFRLMFILPIFICCEHLSYNINKTVELIREIVALNQLSCLDCKYQSLTLRLQHQSTSTQICGFLNITYGSFLTIMTTALGFLLLQLQFLK